MVAAFNRRDVPGLAEMVTDRVRSGSPGPAPWSTPPTRGRRGLASYFRDADVWEVLNLDVREYRDLGDEVLVAGVFHLRGGGSGVEVRTPVLLRVLLKGGKLARVLGSRTEAGALAALGRPG